MIDINDYIKLSLLERQSHLNLNEGCLERGGMSTYFKGLLAHVLNTTIPNGMKILVCHACGNAKCSNPTIYILAHQKKMLLMHLSMEQ